MIKRKINLIINREDFQKYENYFLLLKKSVFGLILIFFIVFIYFFISIKITNEKIDTLNSEKASLLKIINQNTDKYVKSNYLKSKYSDLKNFLKNDASSFFYYSLFNNALSETSSSAMIKEFNINKNRDFDFVIAFPSFSDLIDFLYFVESEKFLKNFEKIFLKNFLVIEKTQDKDENYEISFYGKFFSYEKILKK